MEGWGRRENPMLNLNKIRCDMHAQAHKESTLPIGREKNHEIVLQRMQAS